MRGLLSVPKYADFALGERFGIFLLLLKFCEFFECRSHEVTRKRGLTLPDATFEPSFDEKKKVTKNYILDSSRSNGDFEDGP